MEENNRATTINNYKFLDLNKNVGYCIMFLSGEEKLQIKTINTGFSNITGYNMKELRDFINGNYMNLVCDEDKEILRETFIKRFKDNNSYELIYRIRKKNNNIIWVRDNGYCYTNEEGRYIVSLFVDETEIKNKELDENLYRERLRIGLKTSKTCVFEVNLDQQLYTCFENAEPIFGVSGDKILEKVRSFSSLSSIEYRKAVSNYFSHPEDEAVIEEAFVSILKGESTSYEARMKAGNTKFVWCRIDLTPVLKNGIPVRLIGVITDINDIKLQYNKAQREASLDLFTGLYNKKYIESKIEKLIKQNTDNNHALILIDLDDFKSINDIYGHDIGDKVIKSTSNDLKEVFKSNAIIGRYGGDEFVVFLNNIPGDDYAICYIKRLLRLNSEYSISKSMGIAFYPRDGMSYEELIKNADRSLYEAKKRKNTYNIYK